MDKHQGEISNGSSSKAFELPAEKLAEARLDSLVADELKSLYRNQKELIRSLERAAETVSTVKLRGVLNRQTTAAQRQLQKIERVSHFLNVKLGERKAMLWKII